MTATTIKVSDTTRERIRNRQTDNLTAEAVIVVALDELDRRERRERMRAESLRVSQDPDDLAETRAIMADMEPLRAW